MISKWVATHPLMSFVSIKKNFQMMVTRGVSGGCANPARQDQQIRQLYTIICNYIQSD